MKITVNERRVAEARKVFSPAELNRVAQDAATQVLGPEAKVEQAHVDDISDYKDMLAYKVAGPKLDVEAVTRMAKLVNRAHQAFGDLYADYSYDNYEHGPFFLQLYPATRRNLAANAGYRLSRAATKGWDAKAPEGIDARTFLHRLIAKDCKENRLDFGLTAEEVFELLPPEKIANKVKDLEQHWARKTKRAGKAAKASNVGSRGDYVIEHVYNYGDDTIQGQTLKATDAYDALWKAASAVSDNALIDAKDMFRSVAAMRHYPLHSVFNWINELASEEGAGYIMAVIGPDGKSVLEDGAYVDGEYSQSAADENPGCWSTESGSRKFYGLEGSFYDDVDDADKAEDED